MGAAARGCISSARTDPRFALSEQLFGWTGAELELQFSRSPWQTSSGRIGVLFGAWNALWLAESGERQLAGCKCNWEWTTWRAEKHEGRLSSRLSCHAVDAGWNFFQNLKSSVPDFHFCLTVSFTIQTSMPSWKWKEVDQTWHVRQTSSL